MLIQNIVNIFVSKYWYQIRTLVLKVIAISMVLFKKIGLIFRRKPSWTDRILFKVITNTYENVTLRADVISYNSLPQYTISDHKPVVAQFNIKVSYTIIHLMSVLLRLVFE